MELTRGTKKIVKKAIDETKTINRYKLCEFIAFELESKFKYDTLDYQAKRMGLETTGQILKAIDTYIYKYVNKISDLDEE